MNEVRSRLNGITMAKHPGISPENWSKVAQQLRDTEGARLFDVGAKAASPMSQTQQSSGASFGVPSSSSIEFEADRIKREAKEEKGNAAVSQSDRMKAYWAERKAKESKQTQGSTVL